MGKSDGRLRHKNICVLPTNWQIFTESDRSGQILNVDIVASMKGWVAYRTKSVSVFVLKSEWQRKLQKHVKGVIPAKRVFLAILANYAVQARLYQSKYTKIKCLFTHVSDCFTFLVNAKRLTNVQVLLRED